VDLLEVTTLLKDKGISTVASILKVKKGTIYTFLKSNGLKYIDGEVVPMIDNDIQKYNNIEHNASHEVIQKDNESIEVNRLKELIELIEPIKEVIQAYNKSKNTSVDLRPPSVTIVKQKLFKVDVAILKDWDKFIMEHKEFKVQSLISLALDEFVNKYGK